jgi:peroxiredoxin Q/BCP
LSQFRDEAEFFEQAGVQILGVSTDSVESHAKFRAELGLPFPLLADTEGQLSAMYDALLERDGAKMSLRKIVVIDREGKIAYRDEKLGVGDEADWQAMRDAVTVLASKPE